MDWYEHLQAEFWVQVIDDLGEFESKWDRVSKFRDAVKQVDPEGYIYNFTPATIAERIKRTGDAPYVFLHDDVDRENDRRS